MIKMFFLIFFSFFFFACNDLNVKDITCNDNDGCPSDAVCDDGHCELIVNQRCNNDDECKVYQDNLVCVSGNCAIDTFKCTKNEDCKDQLKPICNELGHCVPDILECITNGDCLDPLNPKCDEFGHCVPDTACIPDCMNKECGENGCGELCGTCESSETCNIDGKCEINIGCIEGETRCNSDYSGIEICNANTWVNELCGAGEYCSDEGAGVIDCVLVKCTEGDQRCSSDGKSIEVCQNGNTWQIPSSAYNCDPNSENNKVCVDGVDNKKTCGCGDHYELNIDTDTCVCDFSAKNDCISNFGIHSYCFGWNNGAQCSCFNGYENDITGSDYICKPSTSCGLSDTRCSPDYNSVETCEQGTWVSSQECYNPILSPGQICTSNDTTTTCEDLCSGIICEGVTNDCFISDTGGGDGYENGIPECFCGDGSEYMNNGPNCVEAKGDCSTLEICGPAEYSTCRDNDKQSNNEYMCICQKGYKRAGDKLTDICVKDNQWKDVSVGNTHTCGITDDGRLFCWGNNASGQLGIGNNIEKNTPQQVGNDFGWIKVSAGFSHTCAIKEENGAKNLYCWGSNGSGELGINLDSSKNTPQPINNPSGLWSEISSGKYYTCGINNNQLFCWGNSNSGQLGLGNVSQHILTPTKVTKIINQDGNTTTNLSNENWNSISTSNKHTCANLSRNTPTMSGLFCWGDNDNLKVGSGTSSATHYTAIKIDGGTWSKISLGQNHTCATIGTSTHCWGSNSNGQTGDMQTITDDKAFNADSPVKDSAELTMSFTEIFSGLDYSCGIDGDGKINCWGNNNDGQFGSSETTPGNYNVSFPVDTNASMMSLNRFNDQFHACFIRDTQLFCWGRNDLGQLGLGRNEISIFIPSLVTIP